MNSWKRESLNKDQFLFHIEEYRSLKTEVEYRVKATERIEYIIIVSIAGIYTWLFKNSVPSWLWWIPVSLVVLGFMRQAALLVRIMQVTEYIRHIETKICKETPLGWEHFLAEKRRSFNGHLISFSGYLLWVILLIISLLISQNWGFKLP